MALGQNLELQILAVMGKMADAVSDPTRLSDLKKSIKANEEAAKRAGVGKDLDKAREQARTIVRKAEQAHQETLEERSRVRTELEEEARSVKATLTARQKALKEQETAATERMATADEAIQTVAKRRKELDARAEKLDAREQSMDDREKKLNEWAAQLEAAAKRP